MSKPLVLNDIQKIYKSSGEPLAVLEGITTRIEPGSQVVITGESGSGKTTLLNIIAGLDRASSGTVHLGEFEVCAANEKQLAAWRNRELGFVFQFHYLLREFDALENIMMPCLMAGQTRKQAHERASELLALVGLGERAKHFPSELSGGERQRVAVARALANQPSLILADEPTGNLDERNAQVVEQLLFGLAQRFNTTLLVVSHSQRLANAGKQRLHLRGGKLDESVTA